VGVARSTLKEYLDRAENAGLSWPLPEGLDDASLEELLFSGRAPVPAEQRGMPSFEDLHKELTRKHVTMQLLWHEYKEANPDGYQYSQFCLKYRDWKKTLDVSLRQDYKAGEKLFVDYAGDTIPVHDR
jgi:transposase